MKETEKLFTCKKVLLSFTCKFKYRREWNGYEEILTPLYFLKTSILSFPQNWEESERMKLSLTKFSLKLPKHSYIFSYLF